MKLRGCYTALVTPLKNGQICYSALKELIEEQIEAKIDGLVPVGTTGESPTLSIDEHKKVIEITIETVKNRCPVIAGTGGNSTAEALELTQFAKESGADATLQVTPYYNKPTQEGLYCHFSKIADDVGLPIVLYNIPGRTGIEIKLDTLLRLGKNSNIIAVKEAGGSVDRVSQIKSQDNDITILSGDDMLTLPMIAVGAEGVISVASNLIPEEMLKLTHDALSNNYTDARIRHLRLHKLFSILFIETNPIPIKAALAYFGKIQEEYRLPLCNMSKENKGLLIQRLDELRNPQ